MFFDIGGVQSWAEIIATLILLVAVLMNKRLDSVPMAISVTFLAIGSLLTVYQNVSRGGLSAYSGSLTSLLVQLLSVPIAVVY